MEVSTLCIKTMTFALMLLSGRDLLCDCADEPGAVFLLIVPNSLQFFEFDPISYDCVGFGGFSEWRVMRKVFGLKTICGPHWETSTGPCLIRNAYEVDSGEYWCEADGEARSDPVNVTVTAGSVILKSPAAPVVQGEDVTLSCINKETLSPYQADFYKNNTFIEESGYVGNISIYNVSKADEGLYKCHIPGVGESPESWLAVRELHVETGQHWFSVFLNWIMYSVAVMVPVVGLGLYWKYRGTDLICRICSRSERQSESRSPSEEDQTESSQTCDQPLTSEYAFYHTID